MRLNGKKFLRNSSQRAVRNGIESRDAIVWAIDLPNRTVSVKIQGSDELVNVNWSENFYQQPPWLKLGAAVSISHPRGNQNRLEITGAAFSIPTALSGNSSPDATSDVDAIVSGMGVTGTSPLSMSVQVGNGTFRIGGVIYSFSGLLMGGTNFIMGENPGVLLGGVSGFVTFDTAPTWPNYRIDILVIAADKVLDYIVGTPSIDPIVPDVPANHILVQQVIVPPEVTIITNNLIGVGWTTPVFTSLQSVLEVTDHTGDLYWLPNDLPSGPSESELTITTSFYDQYGTLIAGTYDCMAEMSNGTGTLHYASEGAATSITWTTAYNVTSTVITYTRTGDEPTESNPNTILIKYVPIQRLYTLSAVVLYDYQGNPAIS